MLYREIRRITKRAISPTIIMCMVGYFSYHMVQGNHGVRAHWRLTQELSNAQQQLISIEQETQKLQNKVKLLRPDSLCRDLLDEQARKVLGYAHPQEIVVLRQS